MNKHELAQATTAFLKKSGVRKKVTLPRYKLNITDDTGHSRDFVVRQNDKEITFSSADVERIIDACLEIVQSAMRRGEPVTIRGFGTLGIKYRPGRTIKDFDKVTPVDIVGRYVPKFSFGNDLRMCARVYGMTLEGREEKDIPPLITDEDFEQYEDEDEDDAS